QAHFLAHGKVQGVFYRKFAIDRATTRGLSGWVQNLPNGKVEGEVQGAESEVEGFLKDLDRGPAGARVVRLDRSVRDVVEGEKG
ncbi:Acylphosphatase, partial [Choiromyces venosus 120613-1]